MRASTVWITLQFLLLVSLAFCISGFVNARQPNVVILYADDMGYGDIACQNSESKIPTPHLDNLARLGIRFKDAHSSSGICTPSRYALLHGRYHWRKFHGIVNSFDPPVLDQNRMTLAELFKSAGYATACIGKWHLGWNWEAIRREDAPESSAETGQGGQVPNRPSNGRPRGFPPEAFDWSQPIPGGPLDYGFDYYFGDDVPNFPPYAWIENDRVVTEPTVPLVTPPQTAEGQWEARPGPAVEDWDFWAVMPTLTEKAVEWIEQQTQDQPFFLYFPFTSPHAPIVPIDKFRGASQAGGYGDFVVQTDDTVGQVLQALTDKGFEDNTLVIFTSDNGPEHYAYERVRKFQHRSMGPLRGLKRDIYEGGHRVPFLIRWPGRVPEGVVSNGLLSQIDLFATLAGLLNTEVPVGSAEDSLDQREMFQGGSSARTTLVHNTFANGYAIRHGDWLLIAAKTGSVTKVPDWFQETLGVEEHPHPGELYDLSTDIGQRRNRYSEFPEQVERMSELLNQSLSLVDGK